MRVPDDECDYLLFNTCDNVLLPYYYMDYEIYEKCNRK